jgi:hypothetical protein
MLALGMALVGKTTSALVTPDPTVMTLGKPMTVPSELAPKVTLGLVKYKVQMLPILL